MPVETSEIVALIGVTGVVSGVLSAFITSSRTLYINSITVERNKWIDKLRTNIAAFCTEARVFTVDYGMNRHRYEQWKKLRDEAAEGQAIPAQPAFDQNMFVDHFRKMQDLSNLIRLQLNPRGEIDANIIQILEADNYAEVKEYKLIASTVDALILHAQWLLKSEWEKVKYEGGSLWYQFQHKNDENVRLQEYRDWLPANGRMDLLKAPATDDAE